MTNLRFYDPNCTSRKTRFKKTAIQNFKSPQIRRNLSGFQKYDFIINFTFGVKYIISTR
jgi:hypothetical protein